MRAIIGSMSRFLARVFWTAAALAFLLEAWLWDHLGAALARLASLLPLQPLRNALRMVLLRTPPVFAFVMFAIPVLAILPFKLLGVALIAKGRLASGVCIFFVAKSVGLGLTAFVYQLCHDRLMLLAWFAKAHDWLLGVREWAHRQVAPYILFVRKLRSRIFVMSAHQAPPVIRRLLLLRARTRRPA